MPNFFQALGAPEAQRAINQFQTDIEERPRREELFQQNKALNLQTIERGRMEMQKMKEVEDYMNKSADFRQQILMSGGTEEGADYLTGKAKKLGVLDENGFGSNRKIGMFLQGLSEQKKYLNDYFSVELNAKKNLRDKSFTKLDNAKEKGASPDELDKLKQEYDKLNGDYEQFGGMVGKTNEVLDAKQKMAPVRDYLRKKGLWNLRDPFIQAMESAYQTGNVAGFQKAHEQRAEIMYKEMMKEPKVTTPHVTDVYFNEKGVEYKQKKQYNEKTGQYDIPIGDKVRAHEPQKPEKPSTFDKTWGIATNIANKKYGGKATEEQIAEVWRKEFPKGMESWMNLLLGGSAEDPFGLKGKPK